MAVEYMVKAEIFKVDENDKTYDEMPVVFKQSV